jgi:hypothetical protein
MLAQALCMLLLLLLLWPKRFLRDRQLQLQ